MEGKPLPLYGDGGNIRDWIHVQDHCAALLRVLESGTPGQVYNIGGSGEQTNRKVTEAVLVAMNKPWEGNVRQVTDRLGHDRRYAIDATKMRTELGWTPTFSFADDLARTVRWYQE